MGPFKTEDVKSEHNITNKRDYRGEEELEKDINTVSCAKQENQVKQDHHEDIYKSIILELKKLDTS